MEASTNNMTAHGFSLVELLIAIVLGAILLAIGIPSFSSLLRGNALVMTANSNLHQLNFARQQAIANQQAVTVCLTTANNGADEACLAANKPGATQLRAFIDNNADATFSGSEPLLTSTRPFTDRLQVTANRQFVRFRPDGTAIGTNLTLQLCIDKEPAINIIVSPSGRARSEQQGASCK